jgi:predicted N-acetyltransferase YhbS
VQPQINVRPAVPADYEAIARITRDSYLAAGYFDSADHPYMQQIQDVARRAEQATIWVAERNGRIVGSVTLAVAGEPYADIALDDELEFRMLVVDPAVQRSGAGQALVGATWESAHGLYRKTGFRRVPERDWFVPDTDIKLLVFRLDV